MQKTMVIALIMMLSACKTARQGSNDTGIAAPRPVTGTSLTCRFKVSLRAEYVDGRISHGTPHLESEPLIIFFRGLGTENPSIRGLGAGGTSYSPDWKPLQVESKDKVVLVEVTPNEKNVFTYTIYRDTGIAVWTRSYTMLSAPTAHMAMGQCTD